MGTSKVLCKILQWDGECQVKSERVDWSLGHISEGVVVEWRQAAHPLPFVRRFDSTYLTFTGNRASLPPSLRVTNNCSEKQAHATRSGALSFFYFDLNGICTKEDG
jgi:hypothetical protein